MSDSQAPESEAERRVRQLLAERGVPEERVGRASREGRLQLLVADALLLPQEERYSPTELSELSGMPLEQLERFWRALGFPNVGRDVKAFGDLDLETVSTLQGILAFWMTDVDASVQMARVIGSSMARIAEAEITSSAIISGQDDNAAMAELFALTADATMPGMARLLEYAWRRHLQAAVRRAMALHGPPDGGVGNAMMAVGFADLVGFTILSQQLSEPELIELVARFESVAHDTVTMAGGRVVKMIGDEAMYVAEDVEVATAIGLSLAEAYSDDEVLSEVRVGLAYGGVVARDGDYYGPVVNLASRIVNIATPGSVLVSDEVHDALGEHEDFEWRSLRPRFLKDLGRVHLWRVQRQGTQPERPDRRTLFGLPRPGMRLGPERLLERLIPSGSRESDDDQTRESEEK